MYEMKWLQSTFANRYDHYRKVHGELFQRRYQSLIVEEAERVKAAAEGSEVVEPRAGGLRRQGAA